MLEVTWWLFIVASLVLIFVHPGSGGDSSNEYYAK